MSIFNRLTHEVTRWWSNYYRRQFIAATNNVEATQQQILGRILASIEGAEAHKSLGINANTDWQTFASKVPVSDYKTWHPWIDKDQTGQSGALCNDPIRRHQPTSGSTSAIKWIPYTGEFLAEINRALMPWISEMYADHQGLRRGFHYWSVSWIPSDLRKDIDENVNDDLNILPWWERLIANQYMAVPSTVANATYSDDTLFASLAWLVARKDLSFISVWSPTFAINLIEELKDKKDELVQILSSGHWGDRAESLRLTPCPRQLEQAALLKSCEDPSQPEVLAELWPQLALISCWDSASSQVWADQLRAMLPQVALEGKGLWATEGAVTLPFAGKFPLAVNSHYYEFMDLNSSDIVPAWKLEAGMEVSPLLTTGSGFLRYQLSDRLLVSGHYNQAPCLEFKGRINGTDLAGEKLANESAQEIIDDYYRAGGVKPVSLLAIPGDVMQAAGLGAQGRYVLLCEPIPGQAANPGGLDEKLLQHFHYKLARELNQLAAATILVTPNAYSIYNFRCIQRGMVEGNIKIEPLVLWNTALNAELEQHLKGIH